MLFKKDIVKRKKHFDYLSSTPLVSVIMNCLNGEQYIKEAIDSVYSQTYSNWEIIFWDNNSTDNTSKITKSFDSRLRYIKSETCLPLHRARNLAIDECRGEIIGFLDADDIWLPNKLSDQVSLIISGYKVVYGEYKDIDKNGKETGLYQNNCPSGFITSNLLRRNTISQGSVLIDADLLKQYKFDENYNIIGDFDLWVRLSISYEIKCLNEYVELSRQHSSNLSDLQKHKWLNDRRYFYKKFLKSNSFFKYPSIIIYIIKSEIKGILNKR